MKKTPVLLIFLVLLISSLVSDEKMIKNPESPNGLKNPNQIRKIPLVEVLQLSDDQEGFYFKSPRKIKIAPNGDVFIQDDNHLYQFDSSGKFIRDLVVKGEGPGEINYLFNFFLRNNEVILSSVMPVKVVTKKINDGSLLGEFKLPKAKTFSELINVVGNRFFFTFSDFNFTSAKTGVKKKDNKFMITDSEGKTTERNLSFETMDAMVALKTKNGNSISLAPVTRLLQAFDARNILYIAHTERYLIHLVDLDQDKILLSFSRNYKPVKFYKEKSDEENPAGNPGSIYKRDFFTDIRQIKWVDQKLLVFTSTMVKGKGILVDVFNQKGIYQDRFYLDLPGLEPHEELSRRPLTFHNGHLWTSYKDDDENPVVVKYQIKLN